MKNQTAEDYLKKLTYSVPELGGEERLRALILYIAGKCLDDPTYGVTKLNKILYFADFISFAKFGEPVTGVPYIHLKYGMVPEPMKKLREDMEAEQDIKIVANPFGTTTQKRVIALKEPDLKTLSARDIAIVDEVIQTFWGETARTVSQLSHDRLWHATEDMENVPYEAAFVSDTELTDYDIARSRELVREYGWQV